MQELDFNVLDGKTFKVITISERSIIFENDEEAYRLEYIGDDSHVRLVHVHGGVTALIGAESILTVIFNILSINPCVWATVGTKSNNNFNILREGTNNAFD